MNETKERIPGAGTNSAWRGLNKTVNILDKVGVFASWTNVIGVTALFIMVAVTFVDVIMRYVFNAPFKGVTEVTEVIMICAIFLAVAHTQNTKSQISVDLVSSKLAPKPRTVLEFITTLLSTGMFGIISWRTLDQTIYFIQDHRVHDKYLGIPNGPFAAVVFLGCAMITALLIRDVLSLTNEAIKLGVNRRQWLIMLGIPALVVVLAVFWMQPKLILLNLPLTGLIGIVFSFVFFFSGMPIAIVLVMTGFLFIGHIRGLMPALDTIGTEFYRNAGNYNWSVLPFFVIMGYFALHGGLGTDLYNAANKWFGHLRGGLSIATIGAGTAFAAVVGDPLASVATIGATALPQMRKYKYDDTLTAGCILGGATLGPIIPPSTPFVLYGLLAGVSIGDLLVSGIIPGLTMSLCFITIIYFWCRLRPNAGPPGEKSNWKERFISLKAGGPVLVLFLLVIGGIYSGIFTPTEGGAVGAVTCLLIGLIMRRYTWKVLKETLLEGGKVISMIFLVLIGAVMFTRFLAWCNVSGTVSNFITNAGMHPMTFVIFSVILLIILGFVIDIMPLMLIGVPILHPIAVSLGINPIWYACLFVLATNLGDITPPIGVTMFTLKAIAKDLPIGKIFKGAWPFVAGTVFVLILILLIPAMATWLPHMLRGH
jgi:tripartite ATP-independent transporter DctM subunit